MPADLYVDVLICLALALFCWVLIFQRRRALKSQWTEMAAIGLVNGFLAFILYLFVFHLAPKIGIPATRWLMLPAVAITVWFFYDMLSRKH